MLSPEDILSVVSEISDKDRENIITICDVIIKEFEERLDEIKKAKSYDKSICIRLDDYRKSFYIGCLELNSDLESYFNDHLSKLFGEWWPFVNLEIDWDDCGGMVCPGAVHYIEINISHDTNTNTYRAKR